MNVYVNTYIYIYFFIIIQTFIIIQIFIIIQQPYAHITYFKLEFY